LCGIQTPKWLLALVFMTLFDHMKKIFRKKILFRETRATKRKSYACPG